MTFADLLKKYSKELNDYWHNQMIPKYKRLNVDGGRIMYPVLFLQDSKLGEIEEIKKFVEKFKDQSDDFKAFVAHYYIKRKWNVIYKYDKKVWNKYEYWQLPEITFEKRTGDCEDQALLWMKLMELLGVAAYKCMIIVDYILGHAYPVYFTGIRTVNMDLTYYANVLRINNRKTFYVPMGDYKTVDYAFNWRSGYKKPYWLRYRN